MNFDFSWFLTIPGMLITGGVLLLIIALIILIVSGKKGKKNVQGEQEVDINSTMNNNVASVQPVLTDNPIPVQPVSQEPIASNVGIVSVQEVPQAPVMPNVGVVPVQEIPQIPVMSNVDVVPVQEVPQVPVMPNVGVVPVQEVPQAPIMPNVDVVPVQEVPQAPVIPSVDVTPVQEVPQAPVMPVGVPPIQSIDQSLMSENTVNPVPINSMEQTSVPIYGGVSPSVPKINLESEHQIYGGANPLENTQAIPTVNNNSFPVQPEIISQPTIINPQVEQAVPQIQEVPVINPVSTGVPVIQPSIDSINDSI